MARQVIGNPFANQIPTVAPTARPVDIYQRASIKKNPLENLANLLSNLEKKAVPALQREEERRAKAEYAEGVELYNSNRIAVGQAVKDGIIEEGESPYLRKGYRISHLNAMSARYADELNNALIAQKLYKTGDPARIEAFTTDFYEKFQSNNGFTDYRDVEVAEYFSGAAAKANETFRASWTSKHKAWQKEQNYAAWSHETSAYIDTLFQDDDTSELRATKMAQLTTWVNGRIKQADVDGMDREKVNETILNSIIMSAYEKNDQTILESLDSILTGTGPLGHSLQARTAMYEANGNIALNIAKVEKAENDARLAANNQRTASIEAGLTGLIVQAVSASGPNLGQLNQQIDEQMVQLQVLGQGGNAKAATLYRAMVKFRQAQAAEGADFRGDEAKAHATAMNELSKFTNIEDVYDFLTVQVANGLIPKGAESSLLSQWNTVYGSAEEEGLDWLSAASPAKDLKASFINSVTTAANLVPDGTSGQLALQAGVRFDAYYQELKLEWMQSNPDKKFTAPVQYQIAAQAVDLATKSAIPMDVIQSVGETMGFNEQISDALSAAQASSDGQPVAATTDALISIIEGGVD